MNLFMYLNLVYWVIAVVGLFAFAKFAAFVSKDVSTLRTVSELTWRIVPLASLFVMVFVFILIPFYFVGFFINLIIASGVVGLYWMLRVKELGARGHLFNRTVHAAKRVSAKRSERAADSQVLLTYLKADDTKMPLPSPEDPLAAGLAIMDQLMISALERHAETIEMTPGANGYDVRMYIDGMPNGQPAMSRDIAEPVITTLKSLAELQIDDRRRPQQGLIKVRDADGIITIWTIRTSGTTAGERLSLSANEKGRWDMTVDQLGMAADQLSQVKDAVKENRGVVLVATPKGAGRTTTLYSLLRAHDAFTNSVQSIEINPQAEIEGVTVNRFDGRQTDATMAKLIHTVFLKDPDVVLIAQVIDTPSAELIAKYGESAHRVYAGMNAPNVIAALELWMAMNPNKRLAGESLRMIISQRLVRVLCPSCRIPYQPDAGTLQKLNLPLGRNLQSFKANTEPLRDSRGQLVICADCGGSGYRGRTGVFEVLPINAEMQKAIAEGNPQAVLALARKNNMMLLVEHGIRKFASGVTSIQEVLRVVAPEKSAQQASGAHPAQRG